MQTVRGITHVVCLTSARRVLVAPRCDSVAAMFVHCPRCALAFSAPFPGAVCPRCGASSVAPTIPPTAATPQVLPPTQHSPAAAPFPPTQAIPATVYAPPPPAPAMVVAATLPAQSPPWAAVYRAQPSITEDRAAIAGRAAVAAALSCLAVVGCCNPLGWFALFASLRAYANTGAADLGPAADRADRALRLAWWAFGSTTAVWAVGIAAWWFNPA